MKKIDERIDVEGDLHLKMTIPNMEIKKIYRESITDWFDKRIQNTDRSPLIRALEAGTVSTLSVRAEAAVRIS